jgi:intraflagellar transport protein 140
MIFYAKAHCFSHAIRLGKKLGLETELKNLALSANKRSIIDIATYLESKGLVEDSIALYQKAHRLEKAAELCFVTEKIDLLASVVCSFDKTTDPSLVLKCAEYFLFQKQFSKAIDLLLLSGKNDKVMKILFVGF